MSDDPMANPAVWNLLPCSAMRTLPLVRSKRWKGAGRHWVVHYEIRVLPNYLQGASLCTKEFQSIVACTVLAPCCTAFAEFVCFPSVPLVVWILVNAGALQCFEHDAALVLLKLSAGTCFQHEQANASRLERKYCPVHVGCAMDTLYKFWPALCKWLDVFPGLDFNWKPYSYCPPLPPPPPYHREQF